MGVTFSKEITIVAESCGHCGIQFGLEEQFRDARRRDGQNFYCPNGHCVGYQSENERLKRELQAQRVETQRQRENYFAEQRLREQEERRHATTRGTLKRLTKRTAAGVCPCCKRTFSQLSRHMHTKHAEFVKENGLPAAPEK